MSPVPLKLASLLLTLCLSACASAIIGGAARGGYETGRDGATDAARASDTSITSQINARYVRDDLISAFDVRVSTYRGTVTLRGSVPNRQAARRAAQLASSVDGVRRVVSHLTIVAR